MRRPSYITVAPDLHRATVTPALQLHPGPGAQARAFALANPEEQDERLHWGRASGGVEGSFVSGGIYLVQGDGALAFA
jgi:hypothetical protein